eukprot:3512270-Prymnesium_polylepis.1
MPRRRAVAAQIGSVRRKPLLSRDAGSVAAGACRPARLRAFRVGRRARLACPEEAGAEPCALRRAPCDVCCVTCDVRIRRLAFRRDTSCALRWEGRARAFAVCLRCLPAPTHARVGVASPLPVLRVSGRRMWPAGFTRPPPSLPSAAVVRPLLSSYPATRLLTAAAHPVRLRAATTRTSSLGHPRRPKVATGRTHVHGPGCCRNER